MVLLLTVDTIGAAFGVAPVSESIGPTVAFAAALVTVPRATTVAVTRATVDRVAAVPVASVAGSSALESAPSPFQFH